MAFTAMRLSHQERSASGYTHRFVVKRRSSSDADYTSASALTILTIATAAIVAEVCVRYVTTSDSTTSATLSVGDNGSATRFVNAANAKTAVTTLAAFSTATAYAATDTLTVTITETGAVTVGEFHIFARVIDVNLLDLGTGSF